MREDESANVEGKDCGKDQTILYLGTILHNDLSFLFLFPTCMFSVLVVIHQDIIKIALYSQGINDKIEEGHTTQEHAHYHVFNLGLKFRGKIIV